MSRSRRRWIPYFGYSRFSAIWIHGLGMVTFGDPGTYLT